ncbi:unnamed protein product, partial [Amoebophrya sp. A25]
SDGGSNADEDADEKKPKQGHDRDFGSEAGSAGEQKKRLEIGGVVPPSSDNDGGNKTDAAGGADDHHAAAAAAPDVNIKGACATTRQDEETLLGYTNKELLERVRELEVDKEESERVIHRLRLIINEMSMRLVRLKST